MDTFSQKMNPLIVFKILKCSHKALLIGNKENY